MIRTTPSLPAIVGRVLLLTMVAAFLANVTGVNHIGYANVTGVIQRKNDSNTKSIGVISCSGVARNTGIIGQTNDTKIDGGAQTKGNCSKEIG